MLIMEICTIIVSGKLSLNHISLQLLGLIIMKANHYENCPIR